MYDRKNTKIKNKFVNPHKKYNENDEFLLDDIIYFEKAEEIENQTTGTLSTEQKGELFLNKINKENNIIRQNIFFKFLLFTKIIFYLHNNINKITSNKIPKKIYLFVKSIFIHKFSQFLL